MKGRSFPGLPEKAAGPILLPAVFPSTSRAAPGLYLKAGGIRFQYRRAVLQSGIDLHGDGKLRDQAKLIKQ